MAVYSVKVDIDIGGIQEEIISKALPIVTQAVASVAEYGASQWREKIFQAKLWSVEKTAYMDSVSWKMVGGFSAEISADYKLAGEIETGRPSYDMKKCLQTSQRTRISNSKKHAGQKYLIIPFRHNVPGNTAHAKAMPDHVYKAAKVLSKSVVIGSGTRVSGSGHSVAQSVYKWGQRLPEGLTPKAKPHHVTDLHHGMVRMNTSAGNGKSSAYLTFRIMGEWSNGWIMPARPGLYIAKDIAESLQPLLDKSLSKAFTLSK